MPADKILLFPLRNITPRRRCRRYLYISKQPPMPMFFKRYVMILFVGIAGSPVNAQEQWSLQQCIDTALQNNLTILQAANSTELNRIGLDQSKAYWVPSVNGTVSQSFGTGRTLNMATYQFTNDNIWGTQYGLNSSMVLFRGFQNSNTIRQQELGLESSEYTMQQVKDDIALAVVNAYLQVVFANELAKLAASQLEVTTAQLEKTEHLFARDLRTESDVLQLRSQVAADRLVIVRAENGLKTARLSLQQLMNTRVPVQEIGYVTVSETDLVLTGNPEDIYRLALGKNAAVLARELETESAAYGIKVARGAHLPGLTLTANAGTTYSSASKISTLSYSSSLVELGYLQNNPSETVVGLQTAPYYTTTDYPYFDQLNDYFNSSVHLSINIPIINYQQTRFNISRQEIAYQNALLEEMTVKNQLRQDIELAYTDAVNAQATRNALREQLEAVKASWKNMLSRYEAGLIPAADLLPEKQRLAVSESDYLQATYQLLFNLKVLDYYRGVPLYL